ncbi:right-handed parallel beta-helix repeat-containing protein [Flavitalea sp. BT771]|uniref:right-handed parallel beta-helix repeat-containing protein n=1 Tax=Flavitalea sp. BT771 TaxID=3063329 RepID=UPI0026E256BF|nr:right-handed parallel beta-helix repeat-containing protein [Flavitalea sp. BT771]MDO6429300.1 right-handed parallel beta-helix repeat-containing protein [Flavitalea sp. BT771]MDV6218572.1 right-handed parallel beta-helix repeat-containing protein [Flavitalea sp. BT771]
MSKLILLIGMMLGFADLLGAQHPHRVVVTDFGAAPGSGKDAVPAIRRALAACRKKGRAILVFPKGRYDLYPDSAEKKEYFLSNTSSETECPSKWKTIGMMLEGMKDLTVEGNGSMLICHGKMITFAMDNCDRIVLRDLELDFQRPTMSEFTIENIAPNAIDVRVHPDSWYKLDSGRLTWYGEGWVARQAHCIRIDPSTQAMFYANEEYEQLMRSQVMETGRFQLSFRGAFDTSRFSRGNIFTVRDPVRDEVGALILSSRNVRLQNLGMHYMHGLGILSQYSEDIFMDSVMIEPMKGSGRRIASFADGMHFSGCKGTIRIAHCRFNGLHDDAINVHGTHLQIVEKRPGNQLVLRFMHPQTYGFEAFRERDSIAFVHPSSLGLYATGRVQHALRLSDREILLTLDKAVPSSVHAGDVVENTTWTPRVIVRNCLITGSNTRGILVTTRRKVVIEGNAFRRLGMQAILIADDALSWYESGPVRDVLIRNNSFTWCGHLIRPAYAIVMAPEDHQLTDTPVHRNIRIENNRFSGFSDAVMAARSVKGLSFINNIVRYTEPGDPAARCLLVACRQVTIRNNQYLQKR